MQSSTYNLEDPATTTTRNTHDFPHLSPSNLNIRNNHRRTLSSVDTQGVGERRNSSLQKVWAEDYYDSADNEGGYTFDQGEQKIPSRPPPATTQHSPISVDEPRPQRPARGHQQSLTAFLPFRISTSRSPERKNTANISPVRDKSRQEIAVEAFMPTLTGDQDGIIKVAEKSKSGIASWFTGSSTPVPVGIPAIDPEVTPTSSSPDIMSPREPGPERQPGKLQKRPTLPAPEPSNPSFTSPVRTNTNATTSRFSGFFSPKTQPNTVQIPASQVENDPLLTLDLATALYPSRESDTFSPAAYKNLKMNAEGTILKLQTAYKIQVAAMHDIAAERDAIREEKEESDLKAQCLQGKIEAMQLQDAEKTRLLAENGSLIQELMSALNMEKRARAEEKEAREKSIALVKAQAEAQAERARANRSSTLSIDTTGEDLGISTVRRNRNSASSERSTESDAESGGGESVFSRSRSPTLTMNSTRTSSMRSSVGTSEYTPEIHQAAFARIVPNPSLNPTASTPAFMPRPKTQQQKSTFQKILSGMSGSPEEEKKDLHEGIGMGLEGCGNCRGKDASAAWDAVGLMRAENKDLKERIGELEASVEGALDLLRFDAVDPVA